jgi:hypothetical protein
LVLGEEVVYNILQCNGLADRGKRNRERGIAQAER